MNETSPERPLQDLTDSYTALLELLAGMQRGLHLYTPYLDGRLYNDPAVLDALRDRLCAQPRLRCQWIVPPAATWRQDCPGLLRLSERLTTALQLRTLPAEEPRERPQFAQSFIIADRSALLLHADPYRLQGHYVAQAGPAIRPLLDFFTEIWEKSAADPELRRLGI